MKLGAAPPADVGSTWRYVPVSKTDAGACPVGTPDCRYERVLQDLDLAAGSAGGVPVSSIGAEAGGGDGYRPSARRRDRRAQEGDLGRGPADGPGARPAHGCRTQDRDVLAAAAEDDRVARAAWRDRHGDGKRRRVLVAGLSCSVARRQ